MNTSDIIYLSLSVLSSLLCIISIVTVIITIRQNRKMIENSTRPYITAYGKNTNFQNADFYLIIKNFGQTGATITDFSCDIDLSQYVKSHPTQNYIFDCIDGLFLAPNQSLQIQFRKEELCQKTLQNFEIKLQYKSDLKRYAQAFFINFDALASIPLSRASTEGKELKIISYALQDVAEKNL